MTVEEDVNKPVSFRPSKELAEAVKTYMGIHKCSKTDAIKRIFQEWKELTEKTQNPQPERTNDPLIDKWGKDYKKVEKILLEEKAKTDAKIDREEQITKVRLERQQLMNDTRNKQRDAGYFYRGPKIGDFLVGNWSCPKGWNCSRCATEPCDRRQQCRQERILPPMTQLPQVGRFDFYDWGHEH